MNELKMIGNGSSTSIFPDEETFQKIYSECLEHNALPTSEAVQSSYCGMNDLFNKYLEAIQENMFRYAYQCGFEAALKKR